MALKQLQTPTAEQLVWLICLSQPEEINKALKEKSGAKALSYVAVPGEVHQIFKKTLSFELVSSYLEKEQKAYSQLEEKPFHLPLKVENSAEPQQIFACLPHIKLFQAIFNNRFDEVMSNRA